MFLHRTNSDNLANNPKNRDNLTPAWKKGESGNPKGRPRRMLRQMEESIGIEFKVSLSGDDKYQILNSMIEMSLEELKNISTDKTCPVFMVNVAKALKKDIENGRIVTLAELFDRFFGKSKQVSEVDVTTKGQKIGGLNELTDDELLRILNERNKG